MDFFKRMSELIEGYTIQLIIKKEEDQLIVIMVPNLNVKNNEVQKKIVPLSLKGSAEQLDDSFWATVAEGLKQTAELQSNLSAYQDSLDKAAKKAKPEVKNVSARGKKTPEKSGESLFDEKAKKAQKKYNEGEQAEKKKKPETKKVDETTGEITEKKEEKPVIEGKKPALAPITDDSNKDSKTSEKKDNGPTIPNENMGDNDEFGNEDW